MNSKTTDCIQADNAPLRINCFWTKFILRVLAVKLELFWKTAFENTVELPYALKGWSEAERGSSNN